MEVRAENHKNNHIFNQLSDNDISPVYCQLY